MDTSDSEGCFESADEDFHSEDEADETIGSSNSDEKGDSLKKNEPAAKASRPEIPECWEEGMHLVQSTDGENRPPARVECCQPGAERKNQSNLHKSKFETRPEFGIPPKIPQCWEPGMQEGFIIPASRVEIQQNTTSLPSEAEPGNPNNLHKKNSETPVISECWEPGMHMMQNEDRPEFGIPPAIVECWEPGVETNCELIKPKGKDEENAKQDLRKTSNANDDEIILKMEQVNIVDKKNNNTIQEDGKSAKTNLGVDGNEKFLMEERKNKAQTNKSGDGLLEKWSLEERKREAKSGIDENNDGSSQKDLWNEDDGWGWNEEGTSLDFNSKSSKKLVEETKKQEQKMQLTDTKLHSGKKVEDEKGDAMWGDDDWSIKSEDKNDANEENLWGDDEDWLDSRKTEDTKDVKKALENLTESPTKENSWTGWGNWGISSVLSTAANITSSVSQGITTALETGIGVPDPEELARLHKAEQESSPATSEPPPGLTFGLTNLVSGVSTITKLVETTGTKVISGGLDTLETIGKKTMEVLQENDPGLKKKYAFLKIEQDKPVLSQILREAKEKAEEENRERERRHYTKKANYETIFDDHQGLVHLEALEMLSKQCEIKLHSVMSKTPADTMADLQETLDQVKELCELLDEDEDEGGNIEEIKEKIDGAVADVKVPISYVKLLDRWSETERWLLDLEIEKVGENEVHQYAIETLAELTAMSVEQFHKAGELLLVKEHRSTADEADSLVQLTTVLTGLISMAASKFSEKLNSRPSHWGSKEAVNSLITNVFLEAANSSRYIQDAFQLLIPVLQVGAV